MTFEEKIKDKFGVNCFVINEDIGNNRAIISDGKFEYVISKYLYKETKKLYIRNMTFDSKIIYYQEKFPSRIVIIDIFKDGNKDPELLFYDKETDDKYLTYFKYDVEEFMSRFDRFIRFKINRESDVDIITKRYGSKYFIVSKDKNNKNNYIISDGEYEWSVTSSPFRRTGLIPKTMTYDSFIKYHQSQFPPYIVVLKYTRNDNEYRSLLLLDKRNNKKYSFSIELDKSEYIKSIDDRYKCNETFIINCTKKYGDKFSYDNVNITRLVQTTKIICPTHGLFEIKAFDFLHVNLYGCPDCGKEAVKGYTKTEFINRCGINNGNLYIIECYNEYESFIKIGITSKSDIKYRFKNRFDLPYNFNLINWTSDEAGFVYDLEKKCHKKFRKQRYIPSIYFKGSTECFDIKIKDEAICFIQELLLNCTQQKQTGFLS